MILGTALLGRSRGRDKGWRVNLASCFEGKADCGLSVCHEVSISRISIRDGERGPAESRRLRDKAPNRFQASSLQSGQRSDGSASCCFETESPPGFDNGCCVAGVAASSVRHKRILSSPAAISQEAKVADLHKAARQYVE